MSDLIILTQRLRFLLVKVYLKHFYLFISQINREFKLSGWLWYREFGRFFRRLFEHFSAFCAICFLLSYFVYTIIRLREQYFHWFFLLFFYLFFHTKRFYWHRRKSIVSNWDTTIDFSNTF